MTITYEDSAWEWMWAPYDEATYQVVLASINPGEIVLEIGAGDLRLARRIAEISKLVYAIEIQQPLLDQATAAQNGELPDNLVVLHGDARELPFPQDLTSAVLLMRHCSHFRLYANKLRAAGCQRLVTNARWRLGTEVIQLNAPRILYQDLPIGWFACWCGSAGFKPGHVDELTPVVAVKYHEVINCPQC